MQYQLHVINKASPSSGGEAIAAIDYASSLANNQFNILLVSNDSPSLPTSTHLNFKQCGFTSIFIEKYFSYFYFFKKIFRENQFDVLHIHGVWSPILFFAAIQAKINKVPIIISPHGCLQKFALNRKPLRKFLAINTYLGWMLKSAKVFIATSEYEVNAIRSKKFTQPIALIPIGIAPFSPSPSPVSRKKIILFLSRLDPGKGVIDLVKAWEFIREPDWKIIIAGSGPELYINEIRGAIQRARLESSIELVGYIDGHAKQYYLEEACLFVLPTYSENFGIAIAEALSAGLPVITTTGAPWGDIVTHRCGWWINPGIESLADTLRQAISQPPSNLISMGIRGQKLILDKYSLESTALRAKIISEWVVDTKIVKPNYVFE